ncbi:MAG: hypothetical protein HZB15_11875, partial [Actinobacteria bacterium]|nr:hypothetical protein [Actinomycetota bacterium]
IDDQAAAGDGPDKPSVGATALLVAGLAQRRDQTGDARYDDLLERMGRFLVGQVEPSGAVSARYDIATRAPVAGAYSIYYTGEVYWALVHLQRLFPDGPWSEAVERVAAYVAGPRDEAEDMGHVRDHWAAYGMSETNASGDAAHDRRLTANQIEYARHQAEISGTTVRWLSQEAGPWGLVVRGRSELRGGGYGTIGEALTRLWRSARAEPDLADLRDSLGSRVLCLAAMTLDHQADNDDAAGAPHPARITGAWFKGGETRMDDQQHALSALLQSIDIVEGTTPAAPTRGDHERPTRWLWLVALVCALNPARTAGAVRRRDAGGRASRAVGWGVGGAVVAVLGAAFVAGPLLDGLDVSNPAFRVSAGALGALAGIVGLVRRRPAADQGTEPSSVAAGLRIAATIASASVLGLTIGAAADRGVALVVVALVISAALTLAAAAPRPGAVTSTVLQLAERATAAVLMVASVLLIVAGVMAV